MRTTVLLAVLSGLASSRCGDDDNRAGDTSTSDTSQADSVPTDTTATDATPTDATATDTTATDATATDTTATDATATDTTSDVDVVGPPLCEPDDNPFAFWRARDAYADASGHLAGTALGNVTITTDGKVGSAFRFDGASAFKAPTATALAGGVTTATITAWVRPSAFGAPQFLVGVPGRTQLVLNAEGKVQAKAFSEDDEYLVVTSPNAIALDRWTHVAAVVISTANTADISLYIDGDYIQGLPFTTGLAAAGTCETYVGGLLGGAECDGPGQQFKGDLDEIAIYASALRSDDVVRLATRGVCGDFCAQGECGSDGVCLEEAVACRPELEIPCNVGATCNPSNGACSTLVPIPETTPCDDGNNCTRGDQCDAEGNCVAGPSCQSGTCEATLTCAEDGSGCVPSAAIPEPLSWWRFEGDVLDSQPRQNNGTAGGSGFTFAADGRRGQALVLDGAGGVLLGSLDEVHTLSAWVWVDSTPQSAQVFGGAGFSWLLELSDSVPLARVVIPSPTQLMVYDTSPLTPGRWVHLAAVTHSVDDESFEVLYRDGRRVASGTQPGMRPAEAAGAIGTMLFGGNLIYEFRGRLDELRAYTEELTDAQIATLYEHDAGGLAADGTACEDTAVCCLGTCGEPCQ